MLETLRDYFHEGDKRQIESMLDLLVSNLDERYREEVVLKIAFMRLTDENH